MFDCGDEIVYMYRDPCMYSTCTVLYFCYLFNSNKHLYECCIFNLVVYYVCTCMCEYVYCIYIYSKQPHGLFIHLMITANYATNSYLFIMYNII